jgi:hypothetical protein
MKFSSFSISFNVGKTFRDILEQSREKKSILLS